MYLYTPCTTQICVIQPVSNGFYFNGYNYNLINHVYFLVISQSILKKISPVLSAFSLREKRQIDFFNTYNKGRGEAWEE